MKDFWNVIQLIFSALGGWLGYFLGGCDGLLYTCLHLRQLTISQALCVQSMTILFPVRLGFVAFAVRC